MERKKNLNESRCEPFQLFREKKNILIESP